MRYRVTVLVLLLLLFITPVSVQADVDPYKKELIDEVLEVTGAIDLALQMADYVGNLLSEALKAVDESRSDEFHDIVRDATREVFDEEMQSGSFVELMYPIYDKYLSVEDLEATIAFYKSDSGKRLIAAMPAMMQEGMVAGQQWGETLSRRVSALAEHRARERGIEITN